ncbi:unnamed protein product [Strongylus vulgaris]|uniref:Protein kinase domain-containing protein n=1 Tax=Strongylus vulgaris TaxID=40348 RepID=A0A3P7M0B7_STRVU|nr:unnamed protein product [Strongylus vulgaris]
MFKQPERRFNIDDSRFYAAEILSGLQHIHSLSYVHRDVKPENCLLAADGHVMISDFGSVKDLSVKVIALLMNFVSLTVKRAAVRRESWTANKEELFCRNCAICKPGGKHAFHDESEYLIYRRIQKLLYSYPPDFPAVAKDCVDRLLVIKPEDRLKADSLRNHEFFSGIDWDNLKDSKPPPIPE